MITVKSDDVAGRVKVYEALVKGKNITTAGIPEAFRVLIKEFQALGLNVEMIDNDDVIHDLKELEDTDDETDFNNVEVNEIDANTGEVIPKESIVPDIEPPRDEDIEEDEDDFEDDEDFDDEEPDMDDLEEIENGFEGDEE
jgi:DNA-directed RNA polymerase subunit beta